MPVESKNLSLSLSRSLSLCGGEWKEYRLAENNRRNIINVRQEKIHEVLKENPFNRLAIFSLEMPGSNPG